MKSISFNDKGVVIDGKVKPHDNPRLGFAMALQKEYPTRSNVSYGADCRIKPNAVIGEEGFGFERDEDGVPIRIPHIGRVILGDRVEVGACTVIARGTIGNTVIGDDVKLDDHVFIAHNVTIGDKTLVVAGAVLCGSVSVGSEVWIGAGALIKEGVNIGDRAFIGMGAVVLKDVEPGMVMVGNPARVLRKSW